MLYPLIIKSGCSLLGYYEYKSHYNIIASYVATAFSLLQYIMIFAGQLGRSISVTPGVTGGTFNPSFTQSNYQFLAAMLYILGLQNICML